MIELSPMGQSIAATSWLLSVLNRLIVRSVRLVSLPVLLSVSTIAEGSLVTAIEKDALNDILD